MTTHAQMQHERRVSDPRILEILAGNNKILELLNERKTYQLLLEQRVESIEQDIDGEGGIKSLVTKHEQRINLALGGMAVLTAVGGLLGWCADKVVKAASR